MRAMLPTHVVVSGGGANTVLSVIVIVTVCALCGPVWLCLLALMPVGAAWCAVRALAIPGNLPCGAYRLGCYAAVTLFWSFLCAYRPGMWKEEPLLGDDRVRVTISGDGKTRVDHVPVPEGNLSVISSSWRWIGRMLLLMVGGLIIYYLHHRSAKPKVTNKADS